METSTGDTFLFNHRAKILRKLCCNYCFVIKITAYSYRAIFLKRKIK